MALILPPLCFLFKNVFFNNFHLETLSNSVFLLVIKPLVNDNDGFWCFNDYSTFFQLYQVIHFVAFGKVDTII